MVSRTFYPPRSGLESSSLYEAAELGSVCRVKSLLADRNTDPNFSTTNITPLQRAVEMGHTSVVKLLLAHPRINVNRGAPLAIAAQRGDLPMVKLLCEHKLIDLNYASSIFDEPLIAAAATGHIEIVEYLLRDPRVDVILRNGGPFEHNALISAAKNGHAEVVKVLLADRRIIFNEFPGLHPYCTTPLVAAAAKGHIEVIRILLADDGIDFSSSGAFSMSLARAAVFSGQVQVVKLIFEINRINRNGMHYVDSSLADHETLNGLMRLYTMLLRYQKELMERLRLVKDCILLMWPILELLYLHARRLQATFQTSILTSPGGLSVFPNRRRPPCTTMPWNIWPALVVLWGVCWMFYTPATSPFMDEWYPGPDLKEPEPHLDNALHDLTADLVYSGNWDLLLPLDRDASPTSFDLGHGGLLRPTPTPVSDYPCSEGPAQTAEPSARADEFGSHDWPTVDPVDQPVTFASSQIVPTTTSLHLALPTRHAIHGPPAVAHGGIAQPILDSEGRMMCNRYGCSQERFTSRSEWKKHMDKHDRPYICTVEGCTHPRGFTSKGDLERHKNSVHVTLANRLPRKSYWCEHSDCSRSNSCPRNRPFKRKDHLQEHIKRIHNGVDASAVGETDVIPSPTAISQRGQSQYEENTFPSEPVLQLSDPGARKRRREEEEPPRSGSTEPIAQRTRTHGDEVNELRRKIADLEQKLKASKAREATLASLVSQYAKQMD